MITRDDIFIVHVTDDMILKGVEYAQKSLQLTFNRMGKANLYDRGRNIVSGIVMENALKRLLDYHNVEYDLLGATHWTKKDRYDVGIKGHRYDCKGFFIGEQEKILEIKKDKRWLLDCTALVPEDQVASRSLKDEDVYVFSFLAGTQMKHIGELYSMFAAGQERYLIHAFWDYDWHKNPEWRSLGQLLLESKMNEKIRLQIGGQGKDRELIIEKIMLLPMSSKSTESQFYTALFVQTSDIPKGTLLVKSEIINKTERITVYDWGNIWVYDGLVYFTGYMSKGEFREKSKSIPRFSKDVKQYHETKTDNRGLLIKELYSLKDILPKKCDNFIA